MEFIDEISMLRLEMTKELIFIPDWINTSSKTDKFVWNCILDTHAILMYLVVDAKLRKSQLDEILMEYQYVIDEIIMSIKTQEKYKMFIDYMEFVFVFMMEMSVEHEMYWAAYNIKEFQELLIKNENLNNE